MFTGIDKVRFRHPVKPGDQVRMEVDIVKIKGKWVRLRPCLCWRQIVR